MLQVMEIRSKNDMDIPIPIASDGYWLCFSVINHEIDLPVVYWVWYGRG